MPETNKELGDFFGGMDEEDIQKQQEVLDGTPDEQQMGMVEVPGKYLMRVRSFCGKQKDDGTRYVAPAITVSPNKGVLMLKLVLEVVDGTAVVPKGSILFHSINLLPPKGSDEERVEQIMRFMKPTVKALTGLEKLEITQNFFSEHLTIDYSVNPFKVTRDHKMKQNVMCVVEEEYNEKQKKNMCRVKYINPAKPGDKSESTESAPEENANLDQSGSKDPNKKPDVDLDKIDLSADQNMSQEDPGKSTVEDY